LELNEIDRYSELTQLLEKKAITNQQFATLAKIAGHMQYLEQKFKTTGIRNLLERVQSENYKTAASQLVRVAEEKPYGRVAFYRTEVMSKLDLFKRYPFVVLETFFSHPNEEDVIYKDGKYDLSEKLPIALYDMLPGSFSSRFPRPYKIRSGRLQKVKNDIYVTADLEADTETVSEIAEAQLPPDFPLDVIQLPVDSRTLTVLKPRTLRYSKMPPWWWRTAPGVLVCPSCSRVPDGDELGELGNQSSRFCPECPSTSLVKTRTVPETFAASWYAVSSGPLIDVANNEMTLEEGDVEPTIVAKLPAFATNLFSQIAFSENFGVTHFYYSLQRRYTNRQISTNPITIFFRQGGKPVAFGEHIHTDGLVFKVNDENLRRFLKISEDVLLTPVNLIQFLFYVVRRALARDMEYFGCFRVFRALLWCILEDNQLNLPRDLEKIRSGLENILGDAERLASRLAALGPTLTPEQINALTSAVRENIRPLTSFTVSAYMTFVRELIVHSLSHAILDSLQEVSGSPEHRTGYFFELGDARIYVFDKIEGGSGFSECARENFYIPFSFRNAKIRQRLGRFDTTPTFLPTQDYLTILERALFECPDYVTYRILFETARLLPNSKLEELRSNQERRADFVKDLLERHRLLLGEQGPFIEYNLRNGLPVLLGLIQERLSIRDYDDLFALSLVPGLLYQRLSQVSDQQELDSVLHYESDERRAEEIGELLALCHSTCATCSLPSSCINGNFEAPFRINQRLLNAYYAFAVSDLKATIHGFKDSNDLEQSLTKAKKILLDRKSLYVQLDETSDLAPVYALLGLRDGVEHKVEVQDEEDVVYRSTNFKSLQTIPDYHAIKIRDDKLTIPFRTVIKLELS